MTPPPSPPAEAPRLLRDVEQALPIEEIFPTGALLLGAAALLGVVLFHGVVMHWVQAHVTRRVPVIRTSPSAFRVNLLMASVVMALLGAAVVEVVIWTVVLKYAGLISTWTAAASYAASSYTTLGNADVVLPRGWNMVGPIIAMSGLFTFGWSGSVLVTIVARLGRASEVRESQAAASQGGGAAGGGDERGPGTGDR